MTRDMGVEEVPTAPQSPWQNPFVERRVGSIRPGPRYRVQREIVATNSVQLFCLRSAVPNAFSLGQRRPGAPDIGTAGTGRVAAIPLRVDYTTDTSASLLSRSKPVASTFAFLERNAASP
jgi:hypothetical protein